MAKKGEKFLTQNSVIKLGLDKVSVITADMLEGYTNIGKCAFCGCNDLTSIEIPNSITSIGEGAFYRCSGLTSITIPNSVIRIGYSAFTHCSGLISVVIHNSVTNIEFGVFDDCASLTSITIRDKTYEKQIITNGKCKAYKAFKANMICRDFQYEEGKTYEFEGKPILCKQGFHACLNLADVFTYYWGRIGKDVVIHEVELEGVRYERHRNSKVVAKKITIGKRIL